MLEKIYPLGKKSIWLKFNAETCSNWALVSSALRVIEKGSDLIEDLPNNVTSIEKLIDFYCKEFYVLDSLFREFYKNRDDLENLDEYLSDLINKTQMSYHEAASDFQKSYMSYVKEGNWPPSNIKSSFSLFDLYVSPKLKENSAKVAYFMIDGLRYELGVELKNQLQKVLATPNCSIHFHRYRQ